MSRLHVKAVFLFQTAGTPAAGAGFPR